MSAAPHALASRFGVLLRRYRLAAGLAQEALAERAGLSPQAISALEGGSRKAPHRDTVARLAGALRLAPTEQARLEAAAVAARSRGPRPEPADAQPRPNLPTPLTSFVGRERELAELSALLGHARLATLTGPGGVGKTRLALEVATAARHVFPDGAVFVSLADLRDPGLVLPTVARAFGVQPGRRALGAVLAELLRPRLLLLVLDNCEQVAEAAPALSALLANCPDLTVLATSRMPLQVYGEQVFPVRPLALPDAQGLSPPEALAGVEAVALFVARAQAVQQRFALTPGNAAAVAAICRQLDGLPLALELAAARVRLLSPAALLRRLERRLALLTSGATDLPARQRTLRSALGWSHDLLTVDEQALFRRVGVFAGGASLENVELVAAAAGPLHLDLLDGLDGLVRHSLLRQEEHNGEPRFTMLETVREFALERLEASGEAAATRDAHVEALLRRLDGALGPETWGDATDISEQDRENLRQALGWCLGQGDVVRGLRLATRSLALWEQEGPLAEGLGWLRRFLDRSPPELPTWLRLRAISAAALLSLRLGDTAALRAYTLDGLALAEASLDEGKLAPFLWHASMLALQDGDLAAAQAAAERRLALARQSADVVGHGGALMQLGDVAHLRGNATEAAARYREALALHGWSNRQWPLRHLGLLALGAGRLEEAEAHFHEALREAWASRQDSNVLENLSAFAALARELGQWERAARLLGAADVALERLGGVLPEVLGRREGERTLAATREALGESAFAAAYTAGRALSLDQAVASALAEDGRA